MLSVGHDVLSRQV